MSVPWSTSAAWPSVWTTSASREPRATRRLCSRLDQPAPRLEHRADVVARLLELHQRRLLRGEGVAVEQCGQDRLVARQREGVRVRMLAAELDGLAQRQRQHVA